MTKKNKIPSKVSTGIAIFGIALVAVLGIGLVVNSFSGGSPKIVVEGDMTFNEAEQSGEPNVGASPGPDVYQRQYFHSGFQSGGDVYSTSSDKSAYTLLSSEIDGDTSFIEWVPINDITLTTMTSSSMYWLGENVGDTRTFFLNNAATTTGKAITFAAGTGVLLQGHASSTLGAMSASSTARIDFIRIPYNDNWGGSATTTANVLMLVDVFYPTY